MKKKRQKPWKNMYWKTVITLQKQPLRWRKTKTAKTMERYALYQWFYRRKKNSRFQLNRLLSGKAQKKKSRKYRRITVHCEMNWHSFYILPVQSPDRQKRMKIHRPGRPDCQKAQKATKRCWKKNWKKH